MTDWRTPATIPLAACAIFAAATLAAAQPSAPLPAPAPNREPAPEAAPPAGAAPRSPGEETALRQARLDELFKQLAQPENESWESVQAEIWGMWMHSGSPSMDLLLQRATKAMNAQDLDLALRFLNDLVRLAPDFAEGWNKRATVYFLREEYGRSIADIRRTLALEPRHFGAISGLGIILERLGDKKGAMRVFRRGLAIHPHLPGARDAVERLSPDVDGREL